MLITCKDMKMLKLGVVVKLYDMYIISRSLANLKVKPSVTHNFVTIRDRDMGPSPLKFT
jgi:hypothetical protein